MLLRWRPDPNGTNGSTATGAGAGHLSPWLGRKAGHPPLLSPPALRGPRSIGHASSASMRTAPENARRDGRSLLPQQPPLTMRRHERDSTVGLSWPFSAAIWTEDPGDRIPPRISHERVDATSIGHGFLDDADSPYVTVSGGGVLDCAPVTSAGPEGPRLPGLVKRPSPWAALAAPGPRCDASSASLGVRTAPCGNRPHERRVPTPDEWGRPHGGSAGIPSTGGARPPQSRRVHDGIPRVERGQPGVK